jgi:hypothetical protein
LDKNDLFLGIKARFGKPRALVLDMGKGLFKAVAKDLKIKASVFKAVTSQAYHPA